MIGLSSLTVLVAGLHGVAPPAMRPLPRPGGRSGNVSGETTRVACRPCPRPLATRPPSIDRMANWAALAPLIERAAGRWSSRPCAPGSRPRRGTPGGGRPKPPARAGASRSVGRPGAAPRSGASSISPAPCCTPPRPRTAGRRGARSGGSAAMRSPPNPGIRPGQRQPRRSRLAGRRPGCCEHHRRRGRHGGQQQRGRRAAGPRGTGTPIAK